MEHLKGLRRLSPCCQARVAHHKPLAARSIEDALALICIDCHKTVEEFELWNCWGQRVWPVKGKLPTTPKRRRRRVPQDAEPESYTVHLPQALSILRRLK